MNTLTAKPCAICESRSYVKHEDVRVGDETFRVCDVCLADHTGPGKFQAENHDDESLALALVLYALGAEADFSLCDEWQGSASQLDRYVVTEDGQGFVEVHTFKDSDAAYRWIAELENDGFGAMEDDGWIYYDSRGISASLGGKHLGTFTRLTRAQAAISLEMRRSGYFPNVFVGGEHGPSVRRIDVW